MTQRLPIHAPRCDEVIAYARVDDDDYAYLAAYRWVMPGTPEASGSVYRARCVGEWAAHEPPALVLSQEIVPYSGAMAAGLTDHVWTLQEVLMFRVPPWPQPQTV